MNETNLPAEIIHGHEDTSVRSHKITAQKSVDRPGNYDANDFYQEFGTGVLEILLNQAQPTPDKESHFKRISLADVWTNPPPPQRYIWGERVPSEALTLLAAHGGTGKSLFALQLAAHVSTGADFLGLPTEQSKTLFFSAEDATNTIRRRFGSLCRVDGLDPAKVEHNLIVLDATDAPCLFHEVNILGVRRGQVTEHYLKLKAMIEAERVAFLIIDNASDAFGANPIDRQHVTQFVRVLVHLVRKIGGAVLMLSHVNKVTSRAGKKQTDSEGYADSAAWHNAPRSRLFLNATDEAGSLSLAHQKNNVGKKQPDMNLAFRVDGSSIISLDAGHANGMASVNALLREGYRLPLMKLIHEFYVRGENISVSANSPGTNAHALLKAEPSYPQGLNKANCLAVIRECERQGFIVRETYIKKDRHEAERWALAHDGLRFIGMDVPEHVASKGVRVEDS
ncbi:AAA family ATPase [Candidatus Nitrotoga arctica]|uniref:AAA domain-containing protein n=1 Tax=Candidatus Nitrotoga arctica TaxID=453162 RepID=A0ABM8YXA7_9PROT|nr:AAA family ATPase [Candidatus Nitrotoga arctica]CAG9932043.1 AAA domain-containing protein [Candidatus Nitrotoga arctica]